MNFRCINNTGFEMLLTVGKIYRGKYEDEEYLWIEYKTFVRVYNCDDGTYGIFKASRFEVVE